MYSYLKERNSSWQKVVKERKGEGKERKGGGNIFFYFLFF
jgi:hypothetical protein